MNEPRQTLQLPAWAGGAIITLLSLQLGLLWIQGTLLQRQHGELQGLREDVQYLAETMDEGQGAQDGDAEAGPRPARTRGRGLRLRPARAVRVAFLQEPEAEAEKKAKQDIEDVRKSERDAIAKARDTREKLSISENIRKADEKALREAEEHRWRPWLWGAMGLGLIAMIARNWLRRRG